MISKTGKVKILILDGGQATLKEIKAEKPDDVGYAIQDILGVKSLQGYISFGEGYFAQWQEERIEKTSLELTHNITRGFPQFIDSKVVISNEKVDYYEKDGELIEDAYYIDVDMKELEKYFNTKNKFWAMIRRR